MFCRYSVFFILSLPLSSSLYLPDSNPLLAFDGQVREVHLYTENHRHGLYLKMMEDGSVAGSSAQSLSSVMELKAVKPGHIVIQGQLSSMYLCVDPAGSLRAQKHYTEHDCTFRELLLADGYTRFLSSFYGFPVSLASNRSPDRQALPFTRFLPLKNTLMRQSLPEQPKSTEGYVNLDSHDLFGMHRNTLGSPHFSADHKK
ncbi:fibroblast growth factor 21 [Synchiropus splendidus]|uniref:fibroblast growth factor 21 n=1 Tax=Synchiropus splendidus TaxID=270530 RepID=UPI00237E8A26|nr:fibroblast growth factor 21 [Synchiropus splendidus]